MIELAYPLAGVLIAGITAHCFLSWLKIFRRRNDLRDEFQAYDRAQSAIVLKLRKDLEDAKAELYALIEERRKEVGALREWMSAQQDRFDALLGNHEKLVARVTANDEYMKSEISKLGGTILDEVAAVKTQTAAAYQAPRGMYGRNLKP